MAPFFFFPCHCVKYFGYRGKKISMSSSKSLSYCGDSQIKRKLACSKTSFLKEKFMMLYDTPKEALSHTIQEKSRKVSKTIKLCFW